MGELMAQWVDVHVVGCNVGSRLVPQLSNIFQKSVPLSFPLSLGT